MYHSLIMLAWHCLVGCSQKKNNSTPSLMEKQEVSYDVFWIPYTAYSLNEYKDRPKLVYVTADWCLTCVQLEQDVLLQPAITEALHERNFIAFRADWSNSDPEVTALLEKYQSEILPFLVIMKPDKVDVVLNDNFKQKELRTLLLD